MFHLDTAIAAWRRSLHFRRAFSADDLDELEAHLRDHVDALVAEGRTPEAAFHEALRRFGHTADVESEYRKVRWSAPKRRASTLSALTWSSVMLKNYLKVALRTLRKQRGVTAINVTGLALGVACCLLIGLYVQEQRRFDQFHTKADQIVRVVENRPTPEGADQFYAYTAGPMGPALVEQVPGVTAQVRMGSSYMIGRRTVTRGPNRFYEDDYLFAGPSFFEVFDFPLLQGDPATALSQPNSVILSEQAAARYFGTDDPLGQTLEMEQFGTLTVTGVLRVPPASHLDFGLLLSLRSLELFGGWDAFQSSWDSGSFLTYLLLDPNASRAAVEQAMTDLAARNRTPEEAAQRQPTLQPVSDIHLGSGHIQFDRNARKSDPTSLYLFSAVALFVLIVAGLNYVNMSTAQAMQRVKEVGLRKAVGARREQLIAQFLTESVLLTVGAAVAALALALVVRPSFNAIAGTALTTGDLLGGRVLLGLAVGAVGLGLLAGAYPAWLLTRSRPTHVLKPSAGAGAIGGGTLRRAFVVIQFALSIGLLIATAVVASQMRFVQQKPLGYNQDQLVAIDINSGEARSQFEAMKQAFAQVPGVTQVSASSRVPNDWKNLVQLDVIPEGAARSQRMTTHFIGIDEDFLATLEIDLVAGRGFDRGRPADSAAVLLNATAARLLGGTPEATIGQTLRLPRDGFGGDDGPDVEVRVIGVVADFHFQSLHQPIAPLVLSHRTNPIQAIDYFTVRLTTADLPAAVAALRQIGERFDPEHPFEYNFLDSRLQEAYEAERRVRALFTAAAGLAVLIACLGLFGLAAFATARRRKEIGVRKVLGATATEVVALLSTDFAKLVGLAFVIAAPVAYLLMDRWLDAFTYRTSVDVGTLLLVGGATLVIALGTVSYQTLRAALANPVDSLRHE